MDATHAEPAHVLLITGSTRRGSTNSAALRAAGDAADARLTTDFFEDLAGLPPFNPDDDYEPLPEPVVELRRRIAAADGVLFCTPEYAGALPGTFKNLLDWTVGGPEMDGKPVAWINVAGEGRGGHAERSLETVLGYLNTQVVEPAGRRIVVPRSAVGDDGEITDASLRADLAEAVREFAENALEVLRSRDED